MNERQPGPIEADATLINGLRRITTLERRLEAIGYESSTVEANVKARQVHSLEPAATLYEASRSHQANERQDMEDKARLTSLADIRDETLSEKTDIMASLRDSGMAPGQWIQDPHDTRRAVCLTLEPNGQAPSTLYRANRNFAKCWHTELDPYKLSSRSAEADWAFHRTLYRSLSTVGYVACGVVLTLIITTPYWLETLVLASLFTLALMARTARTALAHLERAHPHLLKPFNRRHPTARLSTAFSRPKPPGPTAAR